MINVLKKSAAFEMSLCRHPFDHNVANLFISNKLYYSHFIALLIIQLEIFIYIILIEIILLF